MSYLIRIVGAALIWVVVLVASTIPACAAETPEQALRQVQRAIDTSDTALLQRYVDLDAVIGGAVDVFVQTLVRQASSKAGQGGMAPMLAMMVAGMQDGSDAQAAQAMKMLVTGETRKFVLHGVASGKFAGKPRKEPVQQDGGLFSPLFEGASTGRKEIRSITDVKRTGDDATAALKVYDFGNEETYPVNVRLVPVGDSWRVREVTNVKQLADRVRREAADQQTQE